MYATKATKEEIYSFCVDMFKRTGEFPLLKQIAERFKYSEISLGSISKKLKKLEDERLLERTGRCNWKINPKLVRIQVLEAPKF